MTQHDAGYRSLFSFKPYVADLIRGFVDESWTEQLDLDTLERVSGSFVSDRFKRRENVAVHAILTATRAKNRKNSTEDVNVYDASASIAPSGDTSIEIGEPYLSLDHSPVLHSPANG